MAPFKACSVKINVAAPIPWKDKEVTATETEDRLGEINNKLKAKKLKLELKDDFENAKSNLGGVCPKKFGYVNGNKVLIKGYSNNPEEAFVELLAYRLGSKIGVKVNKVKLMTHGKILGFRGDLCSVHTWEPQFKVKDGIGILPFFFDKDKGRAGMSFLDIVINNTDRHGGNWGRLENTLEIFVIDNGYGRPWDGLKKYNQVIEKITRVKESYPEIMKYVERYAKLTDQDIIKLTKLNKRELSLIDSYKHRRTTEGLMFIRDACANIMERKAEFYADLRRKQTEAQ